MKTVFCVFTTLFMFLRVLELVEVKKIGEAVIC